MLSLGTALDYSQADMRDIRRQVCHCLCEPEASLPIGCSPAAFRPQATAVLPPPPPTHVVAALRVPDRSNIAGPSTIHTRPSASSSADHRQMRVSGASTVWPPAIREMSGYRPNRDGWYNPDPAAIQNRHMGMTFSWLWSPLIAHALDGGHNFPQFPSAESPYSKWVETLGIVLALMGGEGGLFMWSDPNVADYLTHANTNFQERVMTFMEQYPDGSFIIPLNDINGYGLDMAVQACQTFNATLSEEVRRSHGER